jgi:hypothetical protein
MNDQIHTINQISKVNPELSTLLSKVEVIYLSTGGKVKKQLFEKKSDGYSLVKNDINLKISNVDKIKDYLDSGIYPVDSKEYIGMKNALRDNYSGLKKDVEKLIELSKKKKKSKKVKGNQINGKIKVNETNESNESNESNEQTEEQTETKELVELITRVNNILPAHRKIADNVGKTNFSTTDDLLSGALTNKRSEKITQLQQEIIVEINGEQQEQDKLLDLMSKSLENLTNLSNEISTTLQTQNLLIEDTIGKTDLTNNQVEKLNVSTEGIFKKINSSSAKLFTYIFCLSILSVLVIIAIKIIF